MKNSGIYLDHGGIAGKQTLRANTKLAVGPVVRQLNGAPIAHRETR